MKTIEVSESALESIKVMAQKLQEERDMLLKSLQRLVDNVDGGEFISITRIQEARAAIAACQESTKVLES